MKKALFIANLVEKLLILIQDLLISLSHMKKNLCRIIRLKLLQMRIQVFFIKDKRQLDLNLLVNNLPEMNIILLLMNLIKMFKA